MTDPIEAMARAMGRALAAAIENDVYACEMTLSERKIIAEAAYAALRDALVPVGWLVVPAVGKPFMKNTHNGWETPLYALPEIK